MKISLSNVAIVEKAQVEIDGITVVAGLNGSGKTTVGKAIYASINAYKNLPERIIEARKNSIYKQLTGLFRNNIEMRHVGNYYEMAHDFAMNIPYHRFSTMTQDECEKYLDKYVEDWLQNGKAISIEEKDRICENVLDILMRTDEVYTTYLVESLFLRAFSSQINSLRNEEPANIQVCFDGIELNSTFKDNNLIKNVNGIDFIKKAIYIESFNVLDLFKLYSPYPIPTRSVTVATRDLFESLLSNEENEQSFEDYENSKEIQRIIDLIITKVTNGKLNMDANGNVDFYDSKTNHSIPISNLSAGIKIFIILQSLLEKGKLSAGDILLIDEPEVNLHPEWQVIFAEILVLLQKEIGLNVYVNTHSPYFSRAIEVKMAQYEIAGKGKFYLLQENENGLYSCEDVSQNTEKIYSMLYKPLETL